MSQNNQSIVNSQEFKDFRKDNNLEVIDLEAIAVFLFTLEKKIKEISVHTLVKECNHEPTQEVLLSNPPEYKSKECVIIYKCK